MEPPSNVSWLPPSSVKELANAIPLPIRVVPRPIRVILAHHALKPVDLWVESSVAIDDAPRFSIWPELGMIARRLFERTSQELPSKRTCIQPTLYNWQKGTNSGKNVFGVASFYDPCINLSPMERSFDKALSFEAWRCLYLFRGEAGPVKKDFVVLLSGRSGNVYLWFLCFNKTSSILIRLSSFTCKKSCGDGHQERSKQKKNLGKLKRKEKNIIGSEPAFRADIDSACLSIGLDSIWVPMCSKWNFLEPKWPLVQQPALKQ